MRKPVLILLAGLLIAGCGGPRRGENPEQQRAVAEVERRQANVGFDDAKPDRPVVVMFPAGDINDADLRPLEALTGLKRLGLSYTKITDAGLQHLKGLTALEELDLSGTEVTDAGLVHLKGLTALRELNVTRTRVTTAGARNLQAALPNAKVVR